MLVKSQNVFLLKSLLKPRFVVAFDVGLAYQYFIFDNVNIFCPYLMLSYDSFWERRAMNKRSNNAGVFSSLGWTFYIIGKGTRSV